MKKKILRITVKIKLRHLFFHCKETPSLTKNYQLYTSSVNHGTYPSGRGRIFRLYQNPNLLLIENIDIENLVSKWKSWKDVSEAALDYGEKEVDPALTHLMWLYIIRSLGCCRAAELHLSHRTAP